MSKKLVESDTGGVECEGINRFKLYAIIKSVFYLMDSFAPLGIMTYLYRQMRDKTNSEQYGDSTFVLSA